MSLFKRSKRPTENFTVIQNELLQSKDLSFRAKGFLCYILSLPDDWVMYKSKVMKDFNIGRHQMDSILNEIKDNGYMAEIELIREGGKFSGVSYVFYDNPECKEISPQVENPTAVNPTAGKQHLQSNNNNKEITKTKKNTKKEKLFEEFYSSYPHNKQHRSNKKLTQTRFLKLNLEECELAITSLSEYKKTKNIADGSFSRKSQFYIGDRMFDDYKPQEKKLAILPEHEKSYIFSEEQLQDMWREALAFSEDETYSHKGMTHELWFFYLLENRS